MDLDAVYWVFLLLFICNSNTFSLTKFTLISASPNTFEQTKEEKSLNYTPFYIFKTTTIVVKLPIKLVFGMEIVGIIIIINVY